MSTRRIILASMIGPELAGRGEGARLREEVVATASAGVRVELDFAGVDAMSPSFADEIFAKIPNELLASHRVRFLHGNDDVKAMAQFVRKSRAKLVST